MLRRASCLPAATSSTWSSSTRSLVCAGMPCWRHAMHSAAPLLLPSGASGGSTGPSASWLVRPVLYVTHSSPQWALAQAFIETSNSYTPNLFQVIFLQLQLVRGAE